MALHQHRSMLAHLNDHVADATSSEDEGHGPVSPDDARAVVGFSIGKEQTRLASPTTPAVEKSAAIAAGGGYFGGRLDGQDIEEISEATDNSDSVSHGKLDPRVINEASTDPSTRDQPPLPWKAETRQDRRSSKTRSLLLDGLFSGRRRASSGPESRFESWQRTFRESLPSIPKTVIFSSPSISSQEIAGGGNPGESSQAPTIAADLDGGTERSETRFLQLSSVQRDSTEVVPDETRRNTKRDAGKALPNRPHNLRRSTSDNSLLVAHTLSRASSLGEDKNWDNVNEQVNSRLKAIKDSFQDSNFRLPSISSLNVSSFTPDFLRERTSSLSWKSSTSREEMDPGRHKKPIDPLTRQPYHSAKAAVADGRLDRSNTSHPNFTRALERLDGDVVILGGYRGSILRSAEPPHRQLWVPIKVGLNIRKVDLEVGIEEGDDEKATEKVIPSGMLSHVGPVDISRRLQKRLKACENAQNGILRFHDYGYDWRLHPLHLSRQLISFLEGLRDNSGKNKRGAIVIAHSLGGLITRHAVNRRPDLFRGVVYAGTPQTCVNILGPLRNGDEVLLSSRVLTAQVNFTIRTSFALLPLDGICFRDQDTMEEYPVDFFDPKTWVEHRLSPCVARPFPPFSPPPKPTGIAGYVASLPSLPLPGRNRAASRGTNILDTSKAVNVRGATEPTLMQNGTRPSGTTHLNGNTPNGSDSVDTAAEQEVPATVSTAVTIPQQDAMEYLTRTLRTVKKFKEELAFKPDHQQTNLYPPIAVIYGKSTPTVSRARVKGKDAIKHADAFDNLAFASGDGVVLAAAAMAPEGYRVSRGGVVSSERGHVTLLGDLEAVGKSLNAIMDARGRGVGLGIDKHDQT